MSVVLPLFSTASARLAADDDQAVRDIHGLLAGSWTDYEPGTGCMVIVVDDASVWPGGCPGGSPGTRETDLLDLTKEARAVNAGTPQEAPDIVGAAP